MSWTDRISGANADRPGTLSAVGQWRWNGPGPLRIRHAEGDAGDVLVHAPDGRLLCPDVDDVQVETDAIPDADAWRSLRAMGESIATRCQNKPWHHWLAESPVMAPLDETLDETELEQKLKARLGDLEEACRKPRAHLHLEEERQGVARCRRPSPRAPMVLASRSEDWDRRTLWGVRPARILGLVRDDLYDLYENRIVVGLIDRLEEALTKRVRAIRRVVNTARDIDKWQVILESGTSHRRAARVCTLWGELWTDSGLRARAESALKRLLNLRRRVLALKDTMLYRKLKGGPRSIQLRMTNVLTNDDTYLSVAVLWQVWERPLIKGEEDAQLRWRRDQEGATGFSRFAALLVMRACDILGMEPCADDVETPLTPGASIRLAGPAGDVTLRWAPDLSVHLESVHGGAPLKVVALPSALMASRRADAWLDSLQGDGVLVLYLASESKKHVSESKKHVSDVTLARLSGPGPMPRPQVLVPVAPWEIESVERVARALRWHIWKAWLEAYPFSVSLPASWKETPAAPTGVRVCKDKLQVLEPPKFAGWPALEQRAKDLRAGADKIESELSALDPRSNRARLHLRKKHDDAKAAAMSCEAILEGYRDAVRHTQELLCCPVCHSPSTSYYFEQADGRSFRVTCVGCDSSWGLRSCNACKHEFPFIATPENKFATSPLDIDRVCGCDVLAFPIEADVYLCTHCGELSDGTPATARLAKDRGPARPL